MKNTIFNKHQFFSLYFGQKVYMFSENHPVINTMSYWNIIENDNNENDYLLLKSIENITDYDLLIIDKICSTNPNGDIEQLKSFFYEFFIEQNTYDYPNPYNTLRVYDYLRSKGYALPYLGLSVALQLQYGWIKII